jgi:transcriptional regulator with GAF, ATPase, and Fis domain
MVEIAAVLRELTAQLIASDDLDDALVRLVDTTADLIEGPSWCGVTLIRAGGPSTAAASVGLPDLGEDQYRTGEGPSIQAIRTREVVLSADLSKDTRWPEWSARARDGGVHGVLVAPVDIDEQVIGALTLYAGMPDRLTPDVSFTALLVAEHAQLLLAAVLDRDRQATLTADLAEALGDGETVNRAIGIMMAQRGCSAETALEVLQETAIRVNLPLAQISKRLVDTIANRSTTD